MIAGIMFWAVVGSYLVGLWTIVVGMGLPAQVATLALVVGVVAPLWIISASGD